LSTPSWTRSSKRMARTPVLLVPRRVCTRIPGDSLAACALEPPTLAEPMSAEHRRSAADGCRANARQLQRVVIRSFLRLVVLLGRGDSVPVEMQHRFVSAV